MTTTAQVNDSGQVTLPKPLRDQPGIRAGCRLEFVVGARGALQVKVLATGSKALAGLPARPGEAVRSLGDPPTAVTEVVRARAKDRR